MKQKLERIVEFVNIEDNVIDKHLIKKFSNMLDGYDGFWRLDFGYLKEYSEEYFDINQYYYLEKKFTKILKHLNEIKLDYLQDVIPFVEEELGIKNLDAVRFNKFS